MINEDVAEEVALHSAGATVRQGHPFAHLPTPVSSVAMTQETRDKWIIPFYLTPVRETISGFLPLCREATPEMTLHLLAEFNWRPRVVGARIVALRRFYDLQPVISNLLLKSEVCFSGADYCYTLAALRNESSIVTLCTYLDYYLRQPDLWFDQGVAMGALHYLDKQLDTRNSEQFLSLWHKFVRNKPNWNLEDYIARFEKEMSYVEKFQEQLVNVVTT